MGARDEKGGAPMKDTLCNQKGCVRPGAYRFTWPSETEKLICDICLPRLQAAAQGLGLELQIIPLAEHDLATDYSQADRAKLADKMEATTDGFYFLAAQIGHHQFLEFAGLMREYVKLCRASNEAGHGFSFGPVLKDYHAKYIGEKMGCIYGDELLKRPDLIKEFMASFAGVHP
jgi:hypothetical protein